MKSRLVPVSCPFCAYSTMLKKETYAVASFDSRLKEQLYSGEYFRFRCPRCGQRSEYAHPMLYYDPGKRFVLLLNEENQTVRFDPDILCVQTHTAEDFKEQLHILEDGLIPEEIARIKELLLQKNPEAHYRYDCFENDVLWFLCIREEGQGIIGGDKTKLAWPERNK